MATLQSQLTNNNSYLQERNRKFYRGHSNFVHPIYEVELNNAISNITNFLNYSILKYAYYRRLQAVYNLSAEKCFDNKSNTYTFSEAEACEELVLERDVVLSNIKNFTKEVEVRLQDAYEKQVKYSHGDLANFSPERYELEHRRFLLRTHFLYRYYYYFTARRLFLDSWRK
jgi:hypothetical protein